MKLLKLEVELRWRRILVKGISFGEVKKKRWNCKGMFIYDLEFVKEVKLE